MVPDTNTEMHMWGMVLIKYIQNLFGNYPDLMIFLSKVGDPRYAFLIYFPVTFCIRRSTGIQVLWLACLSEWLNAVCKWILHGDRPYWYVPEVYQAHESSRLEQFPVTCEIGPGSPSGHAMVTGAVMYVLTTAFLKHAVSKPSVVVKVSAWTVFSVVLIAVNVSRLFLAAHFPHQVIAGTATGVLIAEIVKYEHVSNLHLRHYLAASILLLGGATVTYLSILYLGLDPTWSWTLAKKNCKNPDWINMDTSLFFSIDRDVSSLIGCGVGLSVASSLNLHKSTEAASYTRKALQLAVTMFVILASGYLKIPHNNEIIFYSLSFVNFFMLMITITAVIPWCLTRQNCNKTVKKS